jgi:exodeoxyribonuclease VII small subunit
MTNNVLPPQQAEALTFEAALERIRELVTLLESGDLTLEESIARYQEGSTLIQQCRALIADAELRIAELAGAEDVEDADQ